MHFSNCIWQSKPHMQQHTAHSFAHFNWYGLHFDWHSNCTWQNKLHIRQHTAHHLHWHSTLQLIRHCTSTGTAIAHGKTSYTCVNTQHTICIGTAHFNWYGTALQLAQQSHMAKQATYATTHSTLICTLQLLRPALRLAQQLHMAKQATYTTAHSTPFVLAQHTSTDTALHFNLHSNCIWQNKLHKRQHTAHFNWYGTALQLVQQSHMAKQATYATAHGTPFALAQHTSTGTALCFNWHSNCIWQNMLHMQQHTAHHLHWHSTLQLVRHCTSIGTAISYGKRSHIRTAHGTPFALAQHTSTGTALLFNWYSNCIWQNK